MLTDLLETRGNAKILAFIDKGVAEAVPMLENQVTDYLERMPGFQSHGTIIQPGGEACKRDLTTLQEAWDAIEKAGIDRHSYVLCIGGGAYLDVIGLAAATAHRGVRFVRFPSTTLSQDDSGVGVKNGMNAYGKKNFLGTFSVPYAVVNDFTFLHTQSQTERKAGLIEAVKVALVKDASFFYWLEDHVAQLAALHPLTLEEAVERSALLHAAHISYGGDPFEMGNSRPLDFGHWAAHKLEQLTGFDLSHAEAVAIGVSLDTVYSWKSGRLDERAAMRILDVIQTLQLPQWHEQLETRDDNSRRAVYAGLEEFREHLGGDLTVLLLKDIGRGEDVHAMDHQLLDECIEWLKIRMELYA